jgi:hypothetical protein
MKQKLRGKRGFLQAALQHRGFMAFCEDATCSERVRLRGAGCGTSQPLITLILRFYIFQIYLIPKLQSSFPSCSAKIWSIQGASFVPRGNKKHCFERIELYQKCQQSLCNKEASTISGNSSLPYAQQPQVCNYSTNLAKCWQISLSEMSYGG